MRLASTTDGKDHASEYLNANDHHSEPYSVGIDNTTQSLPPGTTYNYDISLPDANYRIARIMIKGPRNISGASANFYEGAEIYATSDSTEAMGHSVRDAEVSFRVYLVTYSKIVSDAFLTHKIFDSDTVSGNRYINVTDAYITGSTLRIVFKNNHGGSATLWVKGKALVW